MSYRVHSFVFPPPLSMKLFALASILAAAAATGTVVDLVSEHTPRAHACIWDVKYHRESVSSCQPAPSCVHMRLLTRSYRVRTGGGV